MIESIEDQFYHYLEAYEYKKNLGDMLSFITLFL